jgi:hypothetical protein
MRPAVRSPHRRLRREHPPFGGGVGQGGSSPPTVLTSLLPTPQPTVQATRLTPPWKSARATAHRIFISRFAGLHSLLGGGADISGSSLLRSHTNPTSSYRPSWATPSWATAGCWAGPGVEQDPRPPEVSNTPRSPFSRNPRAQIFLSRGARVFARSSHVRRPQRQRGRRGEPRRLPLRDVRSSGLVVHVGFFARFRHRLSTPLSPPPSPPPPPRSVIRVRMASAEHASIAAQTLAVDEELHKDKSEKVLRSEGDDLVA